VGPHSHRPAILVCPGAPVSLCFRVLLPLRHFVHLPSALALITWAPPLFCSAVLLSIAHRCTLRRFATLSMPPRALSLLPPAVSWCSFCGRSNRIPEAAFLARTYAPSKVSEIVDLWKADS